MFLVVLGCAEAGRFAQVILAHAPGQQLGDDGITKFMDLPLKRIDLSNTDADDVIFDFEDNKPDVEVLE